jgi:hypothetical protein
MSSNTRVQPRSEAVTPGSPVEADCASGRGFSGWPAGNLNRWFTVVGFAIAMGWVESAVVFYLRTMVDRIEPYQARPLPLIGSLGSVELVREAATLVMLLAVGMLAGRTWRCRFGYAAIAFGVWDIFYYVFLKVICGWPHSLFDWDILFLLPLPWWGPVLAPVSISLLMISWGTLVNQFECREGAFKANWTLWLLNALGMALALYVFMADAIAVAGQGHEVLRNVRPVRFNWPWFCVAWLLMAAPVIQLCRELWTNRAVAWSGRGNDAFHRVPDLPNR